MIKEIPLFKKVSKILLLVLALLVPVSAESQEKYYPGQTYYGRNNYIQYIAGNLPVILSAPHGGFLTPSEIPDRTWGTTVTDSNTMETILAVYDAINAYTGKHPHIIISRLKRTKLDPNREINEAAQGNTYARQAWNEFHAYIDSARAEVTREYGKGLYLDLHGHGHEFDRLELGYLVSSSKLQQSDAELEQYASTSSLKNLASESDKSFAELIRGSSSFGSMLVQKSVPAVPSGLYPDPGGYSFFSGGYNTLMHGSRYGGTIDGIQIEMHFPGIRDTDENRRAYAQKLTEVIDSFLETHYGIVNYVTSVEDYRSQPQVPESLCLDQNYPNPFNASTAVSFVLTKPEFTTLSVYAVTGELVTTLISRNMPSGRHTVTWKADNLASGLYLIVLRSGDIKQTRKTILLK